MTIASGEKTRRRLEEIFDLIVERRVFRVQEIQFLCSQSPPSFVEEALQLLASSGALSDRLSGEQTTYQWREDPESFEVDSWIKKQTKVRVANNGASGTQIPDMPPEERPRERLLTYGANQLKTSELLAILIRAGVKGESAIQSGQRLANEFQQALDRLASSSQSELKTISRAVSVTAYCQIMAGIELGRRVAEDIGRHRPKVRINSTAAAIEYCRTHFSRLANDGTQEEFHIVTLDTKLQPIQSHQITVGTLDASLVHPREVFRAALKDASAAILLVHNHPSGDATPSREDFQVTDRLRKSGELLGVRVIDHIIVARDDTASLAECS